MKQNIVVITIDLLGCMSPRKSEVWVIPVKRTAGDSRDYSR